jgi:hypothetical protein
MSFLLNDLQDSRRRSPPGEKRHTDPEDVYVKEEKIGILAGLRS